MQRDDAELEQGDVTHAELIARLRLNAPCVGPVFMERLRDPTLKTILIAGCGGGFDFLHSNLLYPELRRLGKTVVILSHSFGSIENLRKNCPVVYGGADGVPTCKLTSASSEGSGNYQPEIGLAHFLDKMYPDTAPHEIYATYARAWTINNLKGLYQFLIDKHKVDGVIVFDGGSDSLMRGDENGLGDPIEDAVSVGACAALPATIRLKCLISVGFGSDRFNDVSDCSSLRAVAELTKMGGFLGALSIEPSSTGFLFYDACIREIYSRQKFRSVLTGMIRSSVKGEFGFLVPEDTGNRVRREGSAFVWPLMAILWAFDCEVVARRSLTISWIKDAKSATEMQMLASNARKAIQILPVEELPNHVDMRSGFGF